MLQSEREECCRENLPARGAQGTIAIYLFHFMLSWSYEVQEYTGDVFLQTVLWQQFPTVSILSH